VKQAKSASFVCLTLFLLVGAFGFGLKVRTLATAPMQQANALATQTAERNHWTVEALGGTSGRPGAIPDSSSSVHLAAGDSVPDDPAGGLYSSDSPLVTFQQVYDLLKEQYVDKISSDTLLAHGAVSSLVAALDDPNSRFLDAAERADVDEQAKGQFVGTGLSFTVRKVTINGLLERQLTVIDPVAGSPAEKTGVKTGDIITDINGHWVVSYDPFEAQVKLFKSLSNDPVSFNHAVDATESKIKDGLTLPAAQTLLDTAQASPLVLSIQRGAQQLKITVDGSQTTTVSSVDSKLLPNGSGYIQFHAFTDSTNTDFQKAFASVSTAPGIVIDLRNCPGGAIDPALAIGQALDPNQALGSIVVRDNHGAVDKTVGFKVKSEPLAYVSDTSNPAPPLNYSGHFVVLVNNGTANTAELLAAFLHDHLGARIVGSSTFGDGLAQTLFPMTDGSGFTLTTGKVMTSTDYAFATVGIKPDEVLAKADADSDVAIQHAVQALALKPLNTSSAGTAAVGQKS